jgi:hypothetical protein
MDFKKGGWSRENLFVVEAEIPISAYSEHKWKIKGKWSEAVVAINELTGD